MLDIALKTIYVIAPILFITLTGFVGGKLGWIDEKASVSLTRIVFYVGMPALLIEKLSRSNPGEILYVKGPYVLIIVSIFIAFLGYITAKLKKRPVNQYGVCSQASFRGNLGFVGLPVALSALGQEALFYSSFILLIGIPLFNILSIIVLFLPHKSNSGKIPFDKMFKGILTNPLIIACIAGFIFASIRDISIIQALTDTDGFALIEKTLKLLGQITLPLALLALGVNLDFSKSLNSVYNNFLAVFYKLLLAPIIGGLLLYLFGANNPDFVTTVIMLSAPVAVFSYVMAVEMEGDGDLAGNLVLSTVVFCFISYGLILFTLGLLGIWSPQP